MGSTAAAMWLNAAMKAAYRSARFAVNAAVASRAAALAASSSSVSARSLGGGGGAGQCTERNK